MSNNRYYNTLNAKSTPKPVSARMQQLADDFHTAGNAVSLPKLWEHLWRSTDDKQLDSINCLLACQRVWMLVHSISKDTSN